MIVELNEYFEYIKAIFLNEYSKYMNGSTKQRINNYNNIVTLNDELTFKVSIESKICFNTDLKNYIIENNLKDESSLNDLNADSKNYINYLLSNEDNVFEVIKNKLLEQIIKYFISKKHDVITIGTVKIICEDLARKYKLPYENIIPSKEKDVVLFIRQIVGEDVLLNGVINNDQSKIEDIYNSYSEINSYKDFTNDLNKKYMEYHKKIGKIFLPDSLYEYERIDYKVNKNIKEKKEDYSLKKLKRLSSIKMALVNMNNHRIHFNALEQAKLQNAIIEINKIMSRLMQNGDKKVIDYIDVEYSKILSIESDMKELVNKLFINSLTDSNRFKDGNEFKFLLTSNIDDNYIKAKLVSSEMLSSIKNPNLKYGFIISPKRIDYISNKGIKYEKEEQTNKTEYINIGDKKVLIKSSEESYLITPDLIISNNIKNHNIDNEILIDTKGAYLSAVYAFVDDDLLNDANYMKALGLSEEYNLPIVTINRHNYYIEQRKDLKAS